MIKIPLSNRRSPTFLYNRKRTTILYRPFIKPFTHYRREMYNKHIDNGCKQGGIDGHYIDLCIFSSIQTNTCIIKNLHARDDRGNNNPFTQSKSCRLIRPASQVHDSIILAKQYEMMHRFAQSLHNFYSSSTTTIGVLSIYREVNPRQSAALYATYMAVNSNHPHYAEVCIFDILI